MNKNESISTITDLIARLCHEINRVFCEYNDDYSQVSWEEAPEEIKNSAKDGVFFALTEDKTSEELHNNWMKFKKLDGWVYGKEKNSKLKTHPSLVEYDKLPESEKFKDVLFKTIVNQFKK